MADLSKITLPNGSTYDLKDTTGRTIGGSMNPIDSHTWTNVYTTANTDAAGFLYFAKLQPTAYEDTWEIYYRVHATIAGVSDANGNGEETSYVYINGVRDTYATYSTWNNVNNTSYRPYYSHVLYRAKQAGIDTNKKGHALGLRLWSSYNPNVAANSRTIQIDILYKNNCTVTWIDPMDIWADLDGTGSTNYAVRSEFDGQTQGSTHSGDRNDTAIYVNHNLTHFKAGAGGIKAYSIILQDGNGTWQSIHTTNGTIAANKVKNSTGFRLGQIYYAHTGTNWSSGAVVSDSVIRSVQGWVDARYSFNIDTNDLIGNEEIYLVGELHSDGLFYLDSPWWTQTEPASDDGKIYIPVGYSRLNGVNTYQMDFRGWHGAYWYKNGCFQEVVLSAVTVNGHSVLKDVPSDAKFTDTTYESKPAVSGGTDVSLVTTGEKYLWNNAGGSGSAPEIFVGTCATAAGTKDKVVTLNDPTGFSLKAGVIVAVKFDYTNTYSSSTTNPITLNVNSTGAKNIYFNVTHSGSGNTGTAPNYYGQANKYIFYVYDGTYWVWLNHSYDNDTNYHMPTCTTAADTAAKAAVCSYYTLLANSYIPVVIQNTNTAASALTLNIQSQGAKPIYINGAASSSSNYTLPRGTYLVFYDGTNYYFRTDGLIQGVTAAATANDTTLATTAYVTRAITTLDEEIAAALAQI